MRVAIALQLQSLTGVLMNNILSDVFMAGRSGFSRDLIAHECAPPAINLVINNSKKGGICKA
jgi:hypothetical protein